LPVIASIYAVLQVNSPIIIGLAIGTGIQGFVISYRKKVINNKCEIKTNNRYFDRYQHEPVGSGTFHVVEFYHIVFSFLVTYILYYDYSYTGE
jgi:hypothetical protein